MLTHPGRQPLTHCLQAPDTTRTRRSRPHPSRADRARGRGRIRAIIYSLTRIFVYDYITVMNPETFLALGEPNRFRIVELLRTGPRPVNDIGGRLGLRQSQVSQHLKVLKEVGLVEVEPRAQQRLYRLRAQPLKQLHKWLDRYRLIWEERFEQLDEIVEELKRKEKSDAGSRSR